MSHNFLFDASFHELLTQIDQDLAKAIQESGCPDCAGNLHQANYPRSPFGLLAVFRVYYNERLSFCCADCRKRFTPPSVRFFGRRWFVAPVFLLICLFKLGINERRIAQVKQHFGITVSKSTWKRWRRWWRERFEQTLFWQAKKGLVATALGDCNHFPRALLVCFSGPFVERLILLLPFLSPLTGGILRTV